MKLTHHTVLTFMLTFGLAIVPLCAILAANTTMASATEAFPQAETSAPSTPSPDVSQDDMAQSGEAEQDTPYGSVAPYEAQGPTETEVFETEPSEATEQASTQDEDEGLAKAEQDAEAEAERIESEQAQQQSSETEGKTRDEVTDLAIAGSRESETGLEAQAASAPHVAYRTHVQTIGWQAWKRDGAFSGTQGQSKRLEGINIKLEGGSFKGGVQYRTHVQTYGWQGWVSDGAMSGTKGESKRLEAIQIKLTGTVASHYDIWYQVHAQTNGWLGWAKNGQRAGTATYGRRLEGIRIRILPKGSAAPGSTTRPYVTRKVQYRTHVQTYGWQGWSYDGDIAGTTGESKRLEDIRINLPDKLYAGGIEYRTHVQTYGWQPWVRDGAMSGTEGESKRLEGIQVRLHGSSADHYDVYYRVHAQNIGWMGWAKNGAQAGTSGLSKRLEGIQIVLSSKGGAAPASNLGGAVAATTAPFRKGGGSGGSSKPTSPGASTGALKVRGNQLVDKSNNPIQLTGVSTHGLAWFPQYVNDACFKQLRTQWNANVVRLAMYTAEHGGYCSDGNQNDLKDLVKKGVQLATKNDLYAIVDWHILSDANPNTHIGEAKEFFSDISATFKNNTNVLYEICNEPNGGTSWDDIKKYANEIIPVIRRNNPDAIVIVGTPTWSQEVDKAAASPLSFNNVMYSLHFYAATHKDDLRNRMVAAVRGGLPVFVTEFGICDASGNGAIDEASANSWITTMKSLGVSWCMWSLCNKAESASILKSNCAASSGFRTGDLATSGVWLLHALNGSLPAGTDSSQTADGNSGGSNGSVATAKPVTFRQNNFTCRATLTSSWAAGNGKTCYQYDLAITNNGTPRSTWSVTVPFNRAIVFTNGWNGTYRASGSKLAISNAAYNGTLAKGATVTGIGFQVTADPELTIVSN